MGGRAASNIPKIPPPASNHRKHVTLMDHQDHQKWNCQIPWFQKLWKQVNLFRSCTLCVQGSAQKQDVAEPSCRPPSLTLSVNGAREGPAPRVQASSLWTLPCPLPGVSDPLGGTGALPFPSSLGGVTAADLVKPRAKRPRAATGRWRPGASAVLQKWWKQVHRFRSRTLCVQG